MLEPNVHVCNLAHFEIYAIFVQQIDGEGPGTHDLETRVTKRVLISSGSIFICAEV